MVGHTIVEEFHNCNICCVQAVPGVHEAATDCVCALLQCLEDNNNQQALELQLFSGVVSLEEGFHLSVAHEDQEK
jgi:transportin-3